MYDVLIIRNGEISIKGENRSVFEKRLIDQLKFVLRQYRNIKIKRADGRIHIELMGENHETIIEKIKDVFGVVSISPAMRVGEGYEKLQQGVLDLIRWKLDDEDVPQTFKINVKRQDKTFAMKSPEMARDLGGKVLKHFDGQLKVDVVCPELLITAEYKKDSGLIFCDKIKGPGGLPVGINGKACILLSGGIDSPVAAYMMSRRGLYIEAVHFHSFPFTNQRSQDKVMELAKKISPFTGKIKVHMVNLLPIQQEISAHCKEAFMTIISRRFMMAIAEKIALDNGCNSLVTGESLGQVASQTAEGLRATHQAVRELPIFRPLIAFDKEDIIATAKKIDTFETSIIPEEDCCTVFLPKNPATKPSMAKIHKEETKLDIIKLMEQVMGDIRIQEVY